jgi:hypothetical protein
VAATLEPEVSIDDDIGPADFFDPEELGFRAEIRIARVDQCSFPSPPIPDYVIKRSERGQRGSVNLSSSLATATRRAARHSGNYFEIADLRMGKSR